MSYLKDFFKYLNRGAWLAHSVECTTLDIGVVSECIPHIECRDCLRINKLLKI